MQPEHIVHLNNIDDRLQPLDALPPAAFRDSLWHRHSICVRKTSIERKFQRLVFSYLIHNSAGSPVTYSRLPCIPSLYCSH